MDLFHKGKKKKKKKSCQPTQFYQGPGALWFISAN